MKAIYFKEIQLTLIDTKNLLLHNILINAYLL